MSACRLRGPPAEWIPNRKASGAATVLFLQNQLQRDADNLRRQPLARFVTADLAAAPTYLSAIAETSRP